MSNTPLTIAIESLSVVADPNDIVRFGDNISDVVRDFHVCGWLQHARIRKGSPNCGSMALQRIMEKPVPQGKTVCWTYVLHAEQIASARRTRDNPRMKIASLNDGAATYRRFKHAEDFIQLKATLRELKKRSVPAGEPDTKAPQAKTHKGATEATIMHGGLYFTKLLDENDEESMVVCCKLPECNWEKSVYTKGRQGPKRKKDATRIWEYHCKKDHGSLQKEDDPRFFPRRKKQGKRTRESDEEEDGRGKKTGRRSPPPVSENGESDMSEKSDLGEEEEEEEEEDEEDVGTVLVSAAEPRATRSSKRVVKAPVGGKAPMGARMQAPYAGVERAPSQAVTRAVRAGMPSSRRLTNDDGGGDELDVDVCRDADTGVGEGNTKSENAEVAELRKQVQLLKEQKEAADKKAADEKKAHEEEKVASATLMKDSTDKVSTMAGQIKRLEEMMASHGGRENADSKGTVPPHTQPFPLASQNPQAFGSSRAGLFGVPNLQPSPKEDTPNQDGLRTDAYAGNAAFLQQQNEQMEQRLQQMEHMVMMQQQIMQQQQQMHPTHTLGMQTPTPQQQGTMVNIGQFCRSAPAPGMHNLVPANQVHPGSRMQTFVSPQSTQLGDGQGGNIDVAMALAQEKGRREQEEKAKLDAVLQKFASRGGGGGHHGFGGGMGGM